MADLREIERHQSGEGRDRDHRHSGARPDARGRADRRGARLFVPGLCRPQGPRRAGRRHRAAADGELRAQAVWQRDHRELEIRGREAGRRRGVPRRLLERLEGHDQNSAAAVNSVLDREDSAKKEVELERLRMAIRDNVLTPEARANGLGAIDPARLAAAIDQIALTFPFKAKPKADDIFDPAFLPAAASRKLD